MKKIFLAIILSGIISLANAQTEKGDWLVGGRLDLNTGDNSTYIGFTPDAGIFIINNLAIGGNIGIIYDKAGDGKTTKFNVGPFVRYYFTTAKVRPLLEAAFGYVSSKYKEPGFSATNNGSNLFLGGGAAAFINENVSIELLMGYSRTKYSEFAPDGGFNLGIGFQVYLNKRQVEKLRGQ